MSQHDVPTRIGEQRIRKTYSASLLEQAWLIAVLLSPALLLPACREETPTAEPSTAASETASPQTVSQQAGTQSRSQAANESIQPPQAPPQGVDSQDDPDAPRSLPKTSELRGWVKSEPIRVAGVEQLTRFIKNNAQRSTIETFHIRRVAHCAYQNKHGTGRVFLIEAASPADAFGIFSVLNAQPGKLRSADGSIRAARGSATQPVLAAWQGEAYIEVEFTGCSPDNSEDWMACQRLFDAIVFNFPAGDPPLLLQAVPRDRRDACKVWVVRRSSALTVTKNKILKQIRPRDMDRRLGLTGDTTLSVAAVPVAQDEPPNLIWIVKYVNATDATAAYNRYHQALRSPANRLDSMTILDQPKGRFLTGSWTADQESIPGKGLLPILRETLPE